MALVISIRFRENGKIYDFAAGDYRPMVGDFVVVETARGVECGEVATPVFMPEFLEQAGSSP